VILLVPTNRLLDHGWSIDGSNDHTSHEAIYLHDPDLNGIELAWDRDPGYWKPWYIATMEQMPILNKPLDFKSLLAELDETPSEDTSHHKIPED
jgi:catechol 2,3-dioxygenase